VLVYSDTVSSATTKTTATATQRRSFWQSPRFQKRALVLSSLVLVAGVIAFATTQLGSDKSLNAPLRNIPPKDVSKVSKTVKLAPGARNVAREFILTAVGRTNLRRAWQISGPHIRQGMTLKQWLTGTIPVIPYPADAIGVAPMKIDYSYRNKALIEVALLPKPGHKIRPTIFFVSLIRVGPAGKQHWLVDGWTPRVPVQIPSNNP
jgi:hypothetical protein